MTSFVLLVSQHAPLLAAGASVLLALGCVGLWLTRSPVHRQRVAEVSLLAVLSWLALACAPLPRLMTPSFSLVQPQPIVNAPPEISHSDQDIRLLESPLAGPLLPVAADLPPSPAPEATPEFPASEIVPSREFAFSPAAPTPSPDADQATVASVLELPSIWAALACTYLVGAALCATWLLLGSLLLARLRHTAQRSPPWLIELLDQLAAKSQCERPRLIVSRCCSRPLCWGIWRPVIVLPARLCRQENESQLRTILLHELGHVAQGDAWGNLLLCAALPLLYWHPLFWWLRGQMRLAAELVADDWAARQLGKEQYVAELVSLARFVGGGLLPMGTTGVFSSPSVFYRRMQMLLAREVPLSTRVSKLWHCVSLAAALAIVMIGAVSFGIRSAPADPPADEAKLTPPAAPAPTTPVAPPAAEAAPSPGAPRLPVPAKPGSLVTEPELPAPATLAPVAVPPAPGVTLPTAEPTAPRKPTTAATQDAIRRLEVEKATLLKQIQDLQARLLALGEPKVPTKKRVTQSPKTVRLTRAEENGVVFDEVWTVDEEGKPDRLIQRTIAGATTKAAPATTKPSSDTDSEAKPAPAPRSGQSSDYAPPGKPLVVPLIGPSIITGDPKRIVPIDAKLPAAQPLVEAATPSGSSRQLDLISLATSYADAVGALEIAKARLSEVEPLASRNVVSAQELNVARLGLQNAQRKEQLLRRIAEAALASSKQELEHISRLQKSGYASPATLSEAQARLEILEQILGTRTEGGAKTGASEGLRK